MALAVVTGSVMQNAACSLIRQMHAPSLDASSPWAGGPMTSSHGVCAAGPTVVTASSVLSHCGHHLLNVRQQIINGECHS